MSLPPGWSSGLSDPHGVLLLYEALDLQGPAAPTHAERVSTEDGDAGCALSSELVGHRPQAGGLRAPHLLPADGAHRCLTAAPGEHQALGAPEAQAAVAAGRERRLGRNLPAREAHLSSSIPRRCLRRRRRRRCCLPSG